MRRAIAFVCGLFLVVQGVAFAAPHSSTSMQATAVSAMGMQHCHLDAKADHGAKSSCCTVHDGCGACSPNVAAGIPAAAFVAVPPGSAPMLPHRVDRLIVPDPDPRLRPPTLFLG